MENKLTWDEMYNYLIKQENCIIHDKELKVINMYDTLSRFNKSILLYEPDERRKNANCKRLKNLLSRIYHAHKENKFKNIVL